MNALAPRGNRVGVHAWLTLILLAGCGTHARPEPRVPVLRGTGPSLRVAFASRLPWPQRIVDVTAAIDGRLVVGRAPPSEVAHAVVEPGQHGLTLLVRVAHPCHPAGDEMATIRHHIELEIAPKPAAVLATIEGSILERTLSLDVDEHGTITWEDHHAAALREVRAFGAISTTPLDCSAYGRRPERVPCHIESMLRDAWRNRDVEGAACLIPKLRHARAAAGMAPDVRVRELRIAEQEAYQCVSPGCYTPNVPYVTYPDCAVDDLWPVFPRESPLDGAPPQPVPPISRM